jgi:hypothetical protein
MTVAVPPDHHATAPRARASQGEASQSEHPQAGAERRMTPLSWLLLVLGIFGFAAFWVLLSLAWDRQCSWMAVLGALDIAWMMRLGGWRPGPRRLTFGVLATVAIVLFANWGIAAGQYGAVMGLDPLDSASKLGPNFFLILFQLANSGTDLIWLGIALIVAAVASR